MFNELKHFEQRTKTFFGQNVESLRDQLMGRIIIDPESSKRVQVLEAEAYRQVGKSYAAIHNMENGTLWAFDLRLRRMKQSLIVATFEGKTGACVRLLKAGAAEGESEPLVRMPREGDIANQLGMEVSETAGLAFKDETENLYLIRQPGNSLTTQSANQDLESLLR